MEVDKAYIAGIFDGEGTIGIYKHKSKDSAKRRGYVYETTLYVVNTDKQLIELMYSYFGGNMRTRKKQKENHKTSYAWNISGSKVINVLEIILPYLRLKKRQGELLIEFQKIKDSLKMFFIKNPNNYNRPCAYGKIYTPRMHKIYKEIRKMNKRGI